ncbi:MAG TPA: PKD domain-containing protein [Aeromicrobium sp.]|nr:PKD domain-containing protein [Aeromicrobium sp.]
MVSKSWRFGAIVVSGAALVSSVLLAAPAQADIDPSDPSLPTTVTADALPTVQIDGVVWDQEIVGNTVYVAGEFKNARPAGSAAGTNLVPRANMLAYNLTTGELIDSFAPQFDGAVRSLSISPDGTRLYAGGSFSKVNGQNRYRIVSLDPATGEIAGGTPGANSTVTSIEATSSAIYVGGMFSTLGSASRVRAASFVPGTSTVLPFNPTIPDGNVQAIISSPDNQKVVIGGAFTSVNGSSSPGYGLALLNGETGQSLPLAANSEIRDAGKDSAILALKADADGFYGSGYHFGGGGNVEGSFMVDWNGNLKWIDDCHGDTYDIVPSANVIYQASHKHFCGNLGTGGFPQTEPWSFHHGTAMTKFATGTSKADIYGYKDHPGQPSPSLLNFFPDFAPGTYTGQNQAPWDVETNGDYVVYGGEFLRVNGQGQQGIVRFAKKSIAPQKQGPRVGGADLKVKVRSVAAGTVRISWPGTYDRDNATLTYQVFRGDTGNKIWEGTQTARFWEVQPMGVTDTGLAQGSSTQYLLRVRDSSGNQVSSGWIPVTVGGAGTVGNYANRVLEDGATKFWRLSETSGQVIDWAGIDDTDPGSGVTRGTAGAMLDGSNNAATTFKGNASSVTVSPTLIWGPQKFSVEAWFKTSSTGGIVNFGDKASGDTSKNDRYLYLDSSGKLTFGIYNGSSQVKLAGSGNMRDNQWHHAVGTFDEGKMALYLDGKRIGMNSAAGIAQQYWGYWRVGGDRAWSGNKYFNGVIDDVAIYPKALTANEVDRHWTASGRATNVAQAPADTYGASVYGADPQFYWRLGETSGTNAADSSINGANGTYIGTYTQNRPGAVSANGGVLLARPVAGGLFGIGAKAGGNIVSAQSFSNPQVFSQEVWINTTASGGGRIFGFGSSSNGSTSSNYDRQLYMLDNGKVRFGVYPGQAVTIDSTNALNDGQWHQLVSTLGPDGTKLYVDGVLNASDPNTTAQNYTGYWKLGGDNTWGGNSQSYFAGTVDEAAVYSTQLSPAEVRSHFLASGRTLPNVAPVASFTALPAGASVAFDSSASSDVDGTIASYAWTFGDGTTSTSANPTHVYANSGTYGVSLTVTDNSGASHTVSHLVVVAVPNAAPTAQFTHQVDGLKVDFTSTSTDSDGTIAAYEWNFGDGSTSTSANPSHTYSTGAPRTVTLKVTDNEGGTSTVSHLVDPDSPPAASFTVVKNALAVDFTSTATDDDAVVSHAWKFGDGATSSAKNPSHTYGAPGDYQVSLKVTDTAGQTHEVTETITVALAPNVPPVAAFSASVSGTTANFNAGASTDTDGSIVSYAWDFGDGNTGTGVTASNDYPAEDGTYQVKLTVTDDAGATHSITKPVVIDVPDPGQEVLRDVFGRTVANGWGNADLGGAWTIPSGAAAFSVNGSAGRVSLPAGGGRDVYLGATVLREADVTFDYTLDKPVTGGGIFLDAIIRRVDANNTYRAKVVALADGRVRVDLVRTVSGANTTLGSAIVPGLTYTSGEVLKVRVQALGLSSTNLKIRVYKDGTPEPTAWSMERTDSTPALQVAGSFGYYFYVSGSTTNGPQVFSIDEFTARAGN